MTAAARLPGGERDIDPALGLEQSCIRFEIRDGIRRISCTVSNDALDAAAGMTNPASAATRRRSFERFRTLIHAAGLLRLQAQLPGSLDPIVLSLSDLRRVPPQPGTPQFGSCANRRPLSIPSTVVPRADGAGAPA